MDFCVCDRLGMDVFAFYWMAWISVFPFVDLALISVFLVDLSWTSLLFVGWHGLLFLFLRIRH